MTTAGDKINLAMLIQCGTRIDNRPIDNINLDAVCHRFSKMLSECAERLLLT